MFESKHEYPTAVTAASNVDQEALLLGARWVADLTGQVGGDPLLFLPRKETIDDNDDAERLSKIMTTLTWRTLSTNLTWRGGVVLAAWPDDRHLGRIADNPRTKGLCVVPWVEADVRPWIAAQTPERLSDHAPAGTDLTKLDPVVIEGLNTLTRLVNSNNNLAGSMDKRDAVNVLLTLHDGGYALPTAQIYAWALQIGWRERGAQRLRDLVDRINNGVRPRANRDALTPDALNNWRERAAGSRS